MKYYEIIGHINTFFEINDKYVNDIVSKKEVLNEKIQKSKKILEDVAKDRMKHNGDSNYGRFPFKKNKVFQARMLFFMVFMSLTYLVTNFLWDLFTTIISH